MAQNDHNGDGQGAEARREEPLAQLDMGATRVVILGTAHVSDASRIEVRTRIESGAYDAVAVELCASRHKAITDPQSFADMDLWQVIRRRQVFAVTALLTLSGCQQRLAERLDVEAGAELKEAVRLAAERGLPLALADREIGLTLKRLYHGVGWWRRPALLSRLFAGLLHADEVSEADVEQAKHGETLEAAFRHLPFLGKEIERTLVRERDRYMATKIRKFVSERKPKALLAVVGAGHLDGLHRELADTSRAEQMDATIADLETVPVRGRWWKLLPWLIVAVILAGFGVGFARDFDLGLGLVFDWILINGGLAALGAALAAAHPLTIAAVFAAAPLTSINPTIGAGMAAAAAELFVRKPRVSDFDKLKSDVSRFSGWRRNRVARTLLIFVLSTVGSAVGTYLGGFHIYDSLR